jgi:hypothetical protein
VAVLASESEETSPALRDLDMRELVAVLSAKPVNVFWHKFVEDIVQVVL